MYKADPFSTKILTVFRFNLKLGFAVPLVLLASILVYIVQTRPVNAGDNIWSSIGLYGGTVNSIAIVPSSPQVIYAGTAHNGIYKSTDGGSTWIPQNLGLPGGNSAEIQTIAIDPNSTNILYAATQQGLYKSTNYGENWGLISLMIDQDGITRTIQSQSVAVSPIEGDIVLLGGYAFDEWSNGIFRSTDGGATWTKVQSISGYHTSVIHFAPSAPHIVYAARLEAGIFRSLDAGTTWQPINSGFVSYPIVNGLAVDPFDAEVVYIGTAQSGIFKSSNGGESWMPISGGLGSTDIRSIVVYPHNQQVLYVGGGPNPGSGTPGVYRSFDSSGMTWAPLMTGMDSRAIQSLTIDSSTPPNIYAGTWSSGIWKYTVKSEVQDYSISINDGALFTNQTTVTLKLTAPPGTTQVIISNDGGFEGATWEPFVNTKTWTIMAYGSYVIPRTIYAKFMTNGQVSGQYQDDIILDQTAPTGTIQITSMLPSLANTMNIFSTLNDGLTNTIYLPIVAKNHRPGFTQVGLLLSATDDVSGVGEMLISNDAIFVDAQWEAYATEKNWWVPEMGTTTVYVKFRDRAGNESTVYSDIITP